MSDFTNVYGEFQLKHHVPPSNDIPILFFLRWEATVLTCERQKSINKV